MNITQLEESVRAEWGDEVLHRLQADARLSGWSFVEYVRQLREGPEGVRLMLEAYNLGADDGLSVAEFLAEHPGLDVNDADIAEARASFRAANQWREAGS